MSGADRFIQYVLFASYGNDSIALMQWAKENTQPFGQVVTLFSDTGWMAPWWAGRIEHAEAVSRRYGFLPLRTASIGLESLVKKKKGWPRQGMQFCTEELKITPALRWLDTHDPYCLATCLVGVRREESANRADFPKYDPLSVRHGGRIMEAPLADYGEMQRNALIERAGFRVLPHRSKECFPCINDNRSDLQLLDEEAIAKVERIEAEMGVTSKGKPRTMFRPYRHMGATGIREIVRWANSARGQFDPDDGTSGGNCNTGWCGI